MSFYTLTFDDGTVYQSSSMKNVKKIKEAKAKENVNVIKLYIE